MVWWGFECPSVCLNSRLSPLCIPIPTFPCPTVQFASYLASVSAKDIAYSNLIQVTRSRTARGFVPNYSAGGSKSIDRTEPPIGAKVLLELFKKFNDTWIVELLYDDLLEWNNWFVEERMLGPLGLISLGSDSIAGYTDFAAGQMQGARFESGLDNSPSQKSLPPASRVPTVPVFRPEFTPLSFHRGSSPLLSILAFPLLVFFWGVFFASG